MKKALLIATVPSMIGQFNMDNIKLLQSLQYKVHVACDFNDYKVWSQEKVESLLVLFKHYDISYHQIDFSRSPIHLLKHYTSYRQLQHILNKYQFNLLHCHTPIAAAITRLASRNKETYVIYTAHGFHFFKGAALKNWLLFYPIERILARYTDVLVTINKEDYQFSKTKLSIPKIVYIPGIGINTKNTNNNPVVIREKYRNSLKIQKNDMLLFSAGELNDNKNHQVVIKSLAKINNKNIHYAIAGVGNQKKYLYSLIKKYHLENTVHLLGYRDDIQNWLEAMDIFIFPSKREGLPVSLMEAMVAKKPVICSEIRGNTDLIDTAIGNLFCPPTKIEAFEKAILSMFHDKKRWATIGQANYQKVLTFDKQVVNCIMQEVYQEIEREI